MGQMCQPDGYCVTDDCAGVTCPTGEYCRGGMCRDACETGPDTRLCPSGEVCQAGECVTQAMMPRPDAGTADGAVADGGPNDGGRNDGGLPPVDVMIGVDGGTGQVGDDTWRRPRRHRDHDGGAGQHRVAGDERGRVVALRPQRGDRPGLAVGIAHRGRPLYRRGYGLASVELPLALTPSTRLRVASVTKHFCALAVMLLAAGLFPVLERAFAWRVFGVLPPIVWTYLFVTALAVAGLWTANDEIGAAQKAVTTLVLPALLFLLMTTCDLRAILALGPRVLAVFACAMLTILLAIWKRAQQMNGEAKLVKVSGQPLRLLTAMRLATRLDICPSVAVAAALKADECLIYTDVDGIYTTDPRVVPEARRLASVSFEEMLEMASLGSKVLQIRSVEFAGKYKVRLRVLSSFTPWDIAIEEEEASGTLITFEEDEQMEKAIVSGIAFSRDEAKIAVLGVPDMPGIAYQILGSVAEAKVEVDMIIQNLSKDGKTDFTFTVSRGDYQKTLDLLQGTVLPKLGAASVEGDAKICKISIVGIGMRSHVGVASTMFRTLSEEGINIQMITTSEIKTSVVIDEKYMELAVRALHKAFDLEQAPA